jgi:hypothetical protein
MVARKAVQDSETLIMQNMTTAANPAITTTKPDSKFEAILNAIRDSLCNHTISDDEQYREDMQDDQDVTEVGRLTEDNESRCLMSTISKTVQHSMENFRQKQIRIDNLTYP